MIVCTYLVSDVRDESGELRIRGGTESHAPPGT